MNSFEDLLSDIGSHLTGAIVLSLIVAIFAGWGIALLVFAGFIGVFVTVAVFHGLGLLRDWVGAKLKKVVTHLIEKGRG